MTEEEDRRPIFLTVTLAKGSVMGPSWLAILFVGLFVLSSFALVLVWTSVQEQKEFTRQEIKEIRVLQLHTQDIEVVLERAGIAHRQDFAPWDSDSPTHGVQWQPTVKKKEP